MLKFTNISGDALDCFKPAEVRGSEHVEAGATIEIDADLAEELEDAYVVGEDGAARAWPKALWKLVPEKKSAPVKVEI